MSKGDSAKLDLILQKLQKLDTVEEKLDQLSVKFTALSTKVDSLESRVTANSSDITSIREELLALKKSTGKDIKAIKTAHNIREQKLRATTIRIFNLPYIVGESLDNSKQLACRAYDKILKPALAAAKSSGIIGSVPQQQNVIESCFRSYTQQEPSPSDPPPPVIIRLASQAIKVAIMKSKKNIPVPTDAEKSAGVRRFIVVEDLTPDTHKLLRELQSDDQTDKVWSVNGRIHYTLVGKKEIKKVKNIFDSVQEILSS